jgi:AbrB family looped-hinge helix DNA binding protein
MSGETTVTRGNQITLTKETREKLGISEGDRLVVNVSGSVITISKKNSAVFDDFDDFLPASFERTLKKIRTDEKERLKRLGIIE